MDSPPEVAFFPLDGTWLALFGREELARDAQVSSEGGGFSPFSLAHNVASQQKVDEVIQQAAEAGAAITKSPQPTEWGGYAGYFKDPDGHLWEVAYNPHFWVGPKDSQK